jgi:hypothetical protein
MEAMLTRCRDATMNLLRAHMRRIYLEATAVVAAAVAKELRDDRERESGEDKQVATHNKHNIHARTHT